MQHCSGVMIVNAVRNCSPLALRLLHAVLACPLPANAATSRTRPTVIVSSPAPRDSSAGAGPPPPPSRVPPHKPRRTKTAPLRISQVGANCDMGDPHAPHPQIEGPATFATTWGLANARPRWWGLQSDSRCPPNSGHLQRAGAESTSAAPSVLGDPLLTVGPRLVGHPPEPPHFGGLYKSWSSGEGVRSCDPHQHAGHCSGVQMAHPLSERDAPKRELADPCPPNAFRLSGAMLSHGFAGSPLIQGHAETNDAPLPPTLAKHPSPAKRNTMPGRE